MQLGKLDRAYDLAEKRNNPSAMVQAAKEQNEMLGFHRELAPNEEKEAKRDKLTKQEQEAIDRIINTRLNELSSGKESQTEQSCNVVKLNQA